MYFNDEKSNTNIDRELNDKSILSNLKKNIKKILLALIVLIVIVVLAILIITTLKNRVTLKLNGDNYIKINLGQEYIDPGYIATDKNGKDISNEVKITGEVDSSKLGLYTIVYKLRTRRIQRTIRVIEPENGESIISLKGDETMYLSLNEKYVEPGYTCIDSIDGDITNKVITSNNIDSSKHGAYKVIYTVTNSSNVTTTISRIVIVK